MRDNRYSLVMGRLLVALALGMAASLALPLRCHAQSAKLLPLGALALGYTNVVPVSSYAVGIPFGGTVRGPNADAPDGLHGERPDPSRGGSGMRPVIWLTTASLTLGYAGGVWDHDSGGYRDSFKFLPDKQAHLLASTILAKAVADGTSVKLGVTTCLVAGLAWEWGQSRHHGYASPYDVSYDITGCVIGGLWGRR